MCTKLRRHGGPGVIYPRGGIPLLFEHATSALSERRNNQAMPRALHFVLHPSLDKNVIVLLSV